MNVGDEISVGVGMVLTRAIGHICRQALRRSQPRPFTDQQYCDRRVEQLANFIQDSHSTMMDYECSSYTQSPILSALFQ